MKARLHVFHGDEGYPRNSSSTDCRWKFSVSTGGTPLLTPCARRPSVVWRPSLHARGGASCQKHLRLAAVELCYFENWAFLDPRRDLGKYNDNPGALGCKDYTNAINEHTLFCMSRCVVITHKHHSIQFNVVGSSITPKYESRDYNHWGATSSKRCVCLRDTGNKLVRALTFFISSSSFAFFPFSLPFFLLSFFPFVPFSPISSCSCSSIVVNTCGSAPSSSIAMT